MKISYRWLRDFVETAASPQAIADRLTMAGIEVGSATAVAPGLRGVLVAEIEAVERLPSGGHLTRCQVWTGKERLSVVCGAPNVLAGAKAAFAPPEAVLPGGRTVEISEIRGIVSHGMLCSEAELGAGEEASSILLLTADAPLGGDLREYLGLDDTVLEIEVTPNRPDCLSILGIAREVATLTGGVLRPPTTAVREGREEASAFASVQVLDPELCPRYAARIITGLTTGPSPSWMAQRLRTVGQRPINNTADVTNYVLWELGHPLHAFDYDPLAGHRIVVRRALPGEIMVTLDGVTRRLSGDMLVIADAQRPVGLAGIMGGANSEISRNTRTVLLESAYFHPGSIRRTAKALGLSTEASYRFERGADIEGLREALDRAAQMIADLGGGTVARGVLDVYPHPRLQRRLSLRDSRIQRVAGFCPPRQEVKTVLERLGFGVREHGEALEVEVPSFRRDVSLEDDLVEEVIRVAGYDRIPSRLPAGSLALTRKPKLFGLQDRIRQVLVGCGLQEAITYGFIAPGYLTHLGLNPEDPSVVRLQNPLSADRSVLRPTLLFGLLETVGVNQRRQQPDVRLFELGRTFRAKGSQEHAQEEETVALILAGSAEPRAWHSGRARTDLYDSKGVVETLLGALGVRDVTISPATSSLLEEGRAMQVSSQGVCLGYLGELHPTVVAAFDCSGPIYVAELSLEALLGLPGRPVVHRPLPRFPGVVRDLALVVPGEVESGEIIGAIREMESPLIKTISLFDVYTGEQVPSGQKSLAYSILYQAEDRTLTDEEVNRLHQKVVAHLQRRFGGEVRGG